MAVVTKVSDFVAVFLGHYGGGEEEGGEGEEVDELHYGGRWIRL